MKDNLSFLFAFLAAASLPAQTLTGTVTDPGGAPVANARVTIFLVDTSNFHETRTDANGVYTFENLEPYYFFFGVAKPGFAYFNNATTGIVGTVIHDAQLEPETEQGQWVYQPDMLDYRWYPTLAPLYDERLLILGGGDENTGGGNAMRTNTSEVYDPATGMTQWTDTLAIGNEVSAIVPLFTGKILMTHRPPQLFDPATLQWDLAADFVQGNRMPNGDHCDHELVLRPNGQVVAIGYKSFTPGQPGVNVEWYDPVQDAWTLGSNFSPTRSRAKAVQLPGEKILVLGGHKEDLTDPTPVNNWGYMDLSDLYDPAANTWRRLKSMNWKREYHTITILVPDGRVIAVGGEGAPGNEPPFSIIEAFSPPYLFRGVRPELSDFNKTVFLRGDTIEFETHKTNGLTKVMLMSNAVVTHFMNSGNSRCLELDFTQNGNQVSATLPSDSLRLMPGWYMLFGMVDDIPSVAQIVKIEAGQFVSSTGEIPSASSAVQVFPNPVARGERWDTDNTDASSADFHRF